MIFSPPHLEDGARWAGLRIGLLGGSFDPPHEGHIHASIIAQQTLMLDSVWWLVSPQNPLKNKTTYSFEERFQLSCEITRPYNSKLIVSDIEQKLGTNLTWQTIRALKYHFPKTSFVWISGMDNALTMHKWHNWNYILDQVATAHVARPPAWSLIENCPLKLKATQKHTYLHKAGRVSLAPRHTYWLMQKKMTGASSSALRNKESGIKEDL
ncbi:MAG: nicotinate-nicotinamide nucleotide adenylyltransferase [Alphaproteobacteria bacterium CG_4_9_14_3_um_filter_47_13]|nr:MAG: nicotinate-nicotinamide nucleotide adenylyltransferase [Alphaproteobacteria bacterium CG_4_9_14_3_um_filter_47_13]